MSTFCHILFYMSLIGFLRLQNLRLLTTEVVPFCMFSLAAARASVQAEGFRNILPSVVLMSVFYPMEAVLHPKMWTGHSSILYSKGGKWLIR